ncbi:MAG TPA: TIGR00730 family Rossman fold protein [Acidobacteriaceae bacterium]
MNPSPTSSIPAQHSVCVFCASSIGAQPIFVEAARELGRSIAERGWHLVYGGADVGLMGALADAALAHGGAITGVIPHALVSREIAHRGLTQLIEVSSMHERKAEMAQRADAFLVLPGGLGTLDELCEILTWALLGIHQKPVVLINIAGYWDPFLSMLDEAVAAGFLRPAHREVSLVMPDVNAACDAVARHWLR